MAPHLSSLLKRSFRHACGLMVRIVRLVVDYVLPARCPGCGVVVDVDHSFCLSCWQALDFLGGPFCAQCAEPLALALHDDTRCGACLADPPPYTRMRAAVAYGDIARTLALKLKHGRRPGVARTMAGPMRRTGAAMLEGALVVPVPLHPRRLWWRGYNQAALIARAVVKAGTGELAVDLIERRRSTPMLRGLGRSQRAKTVKSAFHVPDRARARVKGRRVVLIDDVYTTGATVGACTRALHRAGAADVAVLCWARVVRNPQPTR